MKFETPTLNQNCSWNDFSSEAVVETERFQDSESQNLHDLKLRFSI